MKRDLFDPRIKQVTAFSTDRIGETREPSLTFRHSALSIELSIRDDRKWDSRWGSLPGSFDRAAIFATNKSSSESGRQNVKLHLYGRPRLSRVANWLHSRTESKFPLADKNQIGTLAASQQLE